MIRSSSLSRLLILAYFLSFNLGIFTTKGTLKIIIIVITKIIIIAFV